VLADMLRVPAGATGTLSQTGSYAELHTRGSDAELGTDTLTPGDPGVAKVPGSRR